MYTNKGKRDVSISDEDEAILKGTKKKKIYK
jgi:hypothetical protein